jgi:hypothetical protein
MVRDANVQIVASHTEVDVFVRKGRHADSEVAEQIDDHLPKWVFSVLRPGPFANAKIVPINEGLIAGIGMVHDVALTGIALPEAFDARFGARLTWTDEVAVLTICRRHDDLIGTSTVGPMFLEAAASTRPSPVSDVASWSAQQLADALIADLTTRVPQTRPSTQTSGGPATNMSKLTLVELQEIRGRLRSLVRASSGVADAGERVSCWRAALGVMNADRSLAGYGFDLGNELSAAVSSSIRRGRDESLFIEQLRGSEWAKRFPEGMSEIDSMIQNPGKRQPTSRHVSEE